MRKFVPLIIAAILFLSSCTQIITNQADEIRLNKWSKSLKNGSRVSLSFQDDNAVFRISSKDKAKTALISGISSIDGKRIFINDSKTGESYFFDYSLKENKLILKHSGGVLTLKRKNNP